MMLIERRRDRVRPIRHEFQAISDASTDKIGLLRITSIDSHRPDLELVLSKHDISEILLHFPELRPDACNS